MLQKLCCSERVGYTTAWPCFFLPPKMRILRIVNLYEASAMGAFKGSNLLAGVSLVRIAHPMPHAGKLYIPDRGARLVRG